VDRLNTTIDELTAAAEQEARKRPEVLRLMTHPDVDPSQHWPLCWCFDLRMASVAAIR
jgi:hypothetical protein